MIDYKELRVWQGSIKLAKILYFYADNLPTSEKFGLQSQMKRAAVSIASNIAEGATRNSTKEYIHFLFIALGSASELETQLILCNELNFNDVDPNLFSEITIIRKQLNALISSLRGKL